MQQESGSLQDQIQSVEEQLRSERLRSQDAEQDILRLKQVIVILFYVSLLVFLLIIFLYY